MSPSSPTTVATAPTLGRGTSTPTTASAKFIVLFAAACGGACRAFAAIFAAVWLTGTEGPSAVVDSANLVGRVVASRFDGTNDYTTVYFTHDLDRAPSAAVCYVAKGATNAVYGVWQGGWTNKVAIGGIQGDVYDGVEYLENQSGGGQYINTDWCVDWGTGFSAEFWFSVNATGSRHSLCSSYSANSHASLELNSGGARFYAGSDIATASGYTSGINHAVYAYNGGTYNVSLNSTSKTGSASRSGVCANPAFLWVDRERRYSTFSDPMKIYRVAITQGDFSRHLLPVLHNGEGKMLDLCHNTLYANAGTGSFTVGPSKGKIVVPTGGWGQDVPEDPYQYKSAKWTDCRVLVTRRPAALRSAQARPDLRFCFGNAETRTPFAVKGITLTVNSNAVHMVDGILTKKGL